MSYYDILLAKKLSGGGGITTESLSVTANGTYSAPSGKAYSPVVANVPNSYTASDEGKVVSSGALVAQTSATYDTNDTYDTTLINSVTVNVSGGGGGGPANIVTGTFKGTTDEIKEIEIPYSGTGYPVAITVVPLGGPWTSIGSQNNNVQAIAAYKGSAGAPSSTGATKQFNTYYIWSNYGTLQSKNSAMITLTYSTTADSSVGIAFEDATHLLVKFTTAKTAGFVPNVDFYYAITYSA